MSETGNWPAVYSTSEPNIWSDINTDAQQECYSFFEVLAVIYCEAD
jgi:hypothetical protein